MKKTLTTAALILALGVSFGAGWKLNPKDKIHVVTMSYINGGERIELGKSCKFPEGF